MRRDFGSYSNNHTPPGGYRHQSLPGPNAPHYYSENRHVGLLAPASHELGRVAVPNIFEPIDSLGEEYHEYGVELGQEELPIAAYRADIIEATRRSQAVIVIGETGSGKSTQLPQIMIDSGLYDHVYHTQPRRIATYSVAGRVQAELDDRIGVGRAAGIVGYQTAEKSTVTARSRIQVLTDGIEAVRQLNESVSGPRSLHVIDEVHEMNTNMEVTIAVAANKMAHDPDSKFIFTSATTNAPELQKFLGESLGYLPPIIEVPGRTYGLTRHEAPESTVVDEAVKWAQQIQREKNSIAQTILVFEPGVREIDDHKDEIRRHLAGTAAAKAQILPLHARMSKEEQQAVIAESPGLKIILATNVAQTSLTIHGVRVVIDSGVARHIELDDEGVEGLGIHYISQADCDQRGGRAGRLCPGDYVLTNLNKDMDWMSYIQRKKFSKPEILRTDIDRTTLRFAAVGIDMAEYRLLHQVDKDVIRQSQKMLRRLGALDEGNRVTDRGMLMNEFPVRPTSARMLVEARRFSPEIRAYVAAIAASLEVGGLPYFAHDAGQEWRQLTKERSSDYFAQLDIFIASQGMTKLQMAEYDLDVQNMERAREQQFKIARKSGAYTGELLPPSQTERAAIEECIVAGVADWVYGYIGEGNYQLLSRNTKDKDVPREISNRSVVSGKPTLVAGSPYRVEYKKGGEDRERHILERVMAIEDPRVFGRVALDHCVWVEKDTIWRSGKLVARQSLKFGGVIDVGYEREHEAEPTALNQEILLQALLERPGPAQRRLREIKTTVEELQHLAPYRFDKTLTQDDLRNLLRRAMGSELLEQSHVDDNLRVIMELEGVDIGSYVSTDMHHQIIANAPETLRLEHGPTLQLRYRNGHPIATQYDDAVLAQLPESVRIQDGREVLFFYEKRYYTIGELRSHLNSGVASY